MLRKQINYKLILFATHRLKIINKFVEFFKKINLHIINF